MLIVTEKILAEYGKVILELIEQGLTGTDKANILETLQKLTADLRNNGSGEYTECAVGMLHWFSQAMQNAKNDLFFAVAEDIKKALDCYNYYDKGVEI